MVQGHGQRASARGFTLIEAVVAAAVVGVVVCVLLGMGDRSRRLGRLGEDQAHLRELGAMTGAYGADNGDLFWSYSWRHGQSYQTQYPDLNNAPDDLTAAGNQCVYLMRTRGNQPNMPTFGSFFPHQLYSHLVLADYAGQKLPWRTVISAADKYRAQWANDPARFNQNGFWPYQPEGIDPYNRRWPYSGSFVPGFAMFDTSPVGSRMEPAQTYNLTLIPSGVVLGRAQISSIALPAQKVVLYDQSARHFGPRQPYCTHAEARMPFLMGDGSAPVRSAGEANQGWLPNNPASPSGSVFTYNPSSQWEPPAINSASGDSVFGRFRLTRSGLLGRDFGGPEVF